MKSILNNLIIIFINLILSSIVLAQHGNEAVTASNQFALGLYAKYSTRDGNIFYSPYSITSALAITYEGARGKTAKEIEALFHFPEDETIRRAAFLETDKKINTPNKSYDLNIANALWIQKNYAVLDDYIEIAQKYYSGEIKNLDFINQTEPSRLKINSWIEEQTNNKIKNMISQGSITELTRIVITNAIYFKGAWLKQFKKWLTEEGEFKITPTNKVKTQMMRLDEYLNYADTDDLQILELPYERRDLSMLILLPKEKQKNNGLNDIEKSLSLKQLSEWKKMLKNKNVAVHLPKFKFETNYSMSKDLSEMGMPTAFSHKANFSGITGDKSLFISKLIHKAFIDVNEEGTEAAAATAVIISTRSMPIREQYIEFVADHPFIFIIQEKETEAILFMGRVSNPE